MHEFAMAGELVKAVLAAMDRITPLPKLRSGRIVVGALHRVVPENLIFAYEILTRDTPAVGSTLEITTIPARVSCNDCGWQGEVNDEPLLCHTCGGVNLQILQGRELFLDQLEIDDHD